MAHANSAKKRPAGSAAASETTHFNPLDLPNLYGMVCGGGCMDPVLLGGSILVFDRTAKVEASDFVVIYPITAAEGTNQGSIKRLVTSIPPLVSFPHKDGPRITARPALVVEQINPPAQWSIICASILGIHKCIGVQEADGTFTSIEALVAAHPIEADAAPALVTESSNA